MFDGVFFSENRAQAHNDCRQSRFDVLISVRYQFFDTRKNLVHDQTLTERWIEGLAEVADFVGSGSSYLSLGIFQQSLSIVD